jgi:hypothetical protein
VRRKVIVSLVTGRSSSPKKLGLHRVLGALSPGIERQGREIDHWPPYNAEVKNEWKYLQTPICFPGEYSDNLFWYCCYLSTAGNKRFCGLLLLYISKILLRCLRVLLITEHTVALLCCWEEAITMSIPPHSVAGGVSGVRPEALYPPTLSD